MVADGAHAKGIRCYWEADLVEGEPFGGSGELVGSAAGPDFDSVEAGFVQSFEYVEGFGNGDVKVAGSVVGVPIFGFLLEVVKTMVSVGEGAVEVEDVEHDAP